VRTRVAQLQPYRARCAQRVAARRVRVDGTRADAVDSLQSITFGREGDGDGDGAASSCVDVDDGNINFLKSRGGEGVSLE
jgi:hypothetical protein